MDVDVIRTVITVVCFVAFLGIVWWAYGRGRRARFDEAANLPFADEEMQRRTLAAERHDTEDGETSSPNERLEEGEPRV